MCKKILSLLLSIVIFTGIFSAVPAISAEASDYKTQLENAGFTAAYAARLAELHNKYPNWNFKPLITGVNWSTAVANERTPHSQQLIQKTSANNGKDYYCTCSSCYKNGSYVIQEGSTWVSASLSAVEYYMNPVNFLDEKYIFQFESTAYDSSQGITGIETILKNTWMYNSLIVYKTSDGRTVTYTNSKYTSGIKYSEAIYEAAKVSGLSAYYLASKIVQEVGGKTNSATGACGTNSTYPGIYNYYNIGAYSGGVDGLKWAATGTNGYTTNANVNVRKGPSTGTSKLVTLPKGTKVNYISKTGTQSDGYCWYNISVTYGGVSYNGYIREDLLNYSSSDKYGRPWTNPFLTIYNGAKYIANNFSATQNTGYLQKFNVNPASSNMYAHEYMANVQAAASEAASAYNAYNSAGLLANEKNFIIPVFNNMPGTKLYSSEIPAVENIQTYDVTETSVSIVCDVVPGATGYDLVKYENGKWVFVKSFNSRRTTVDNLTGGTTYQFRMRAYIIKDGIITYSSNYSDSFYVTTLTKEQVAQKIPAPTGVQVYDQAQNGFSVVCDVVPGALGYEVQVYKNGKWVTAGIINARRGSLNNLEPATQYPARLRAYLKSGGTDVFSANWSKIVYAYTKPVKVTGVYTAARGGTGERLRIEWDAQPNADGYNVYMMKDGKYVYVASTEKAEYIFDNLTPGWEYYFRVTAYKGETSNAGYGSDEFHTCAACPPMDLPSVVATDSKTIHVDWNITNAHGYVVQWSTDPEFKTGLNSAYVVGHTSNSYTITGLNENQTYYVRTRAWRYWENNSLVYGIWTDGVKA